MKRACVCLLALMLILTGCGGKEKNDRISVKDVCCPYEIDQKKDAVALTLHNGRQSGILWDVEAVPEGICAVTRESGDQEDPSRYLLTGMKEGAAQLTFTAAQDDGKVSFVLTLMAEVDAEGRTVVSAYEHHESADISVEAEGLNYKWNVDVNGVLHFSFQNQEDTWMVNGNEEGSILLTDMMSTPMGCKFSAEAREAGQTTVVLTSEHSERTIHVVIQADESGTLEVTSVQEQ